MGVITHLHQASSEKGKASTFSRERSAKPYPERQGGIHSRKDHEQSTTGKQNQFESDHGR